MQLHFIIMVIIICTQNIMTNFVLLSGNASKLCKFGVQISLKHQRKLCDLVNNISRKYNENISQKIDKLGFHDCNETH